jgi:DNA-binding CsgD family transcriptional regulator
LTRLGDDSEPVPDVNCRSIFLDRVFPKPPLHAFAIELAGREHVRSAHDQKFALFIFDPDGGGALEEQTLCELFQLTPTEARVAAALTDGMTLAEVARQLGLAAATARWHLRHVFAKTHTCRQPELVNLLLRSLSAINRE